jgi:hypothetical protein
MTQQPLDHIPLFVVVIACAGITLAFYRLPDRHVAGAPRHG